ncbi:hypothetical protein MCEMRE239_00958 [Candidatus Nanopelagicaceae bacterium]
MNTPLRNSTPLFGSSKIVRAVLTGVLTLAMGVTGLSSASATPEDDATAAYIAATTAADVQTLFDAETLLDFTAYNSLAAEPGAQTAIRKAIADESAATFVDIAAVQAFLDAASAQATAILAYAAATTEAGIATIIGLNALTLDYTDYNLLSTAEKTSVRTALAAATTFANKAAIQTAIDNAVAAAIAATAEAGDVTAYAAATTEAGIATIIGLNALTLDYTDYNLLSTAEKTSVRTALAAATTFANKAAIQTAIDNAVAAAIAITDVTSSTFSSTAANNQVVVTLTGGTFRGGLMNAASFTFGGTNAIALAAGTFTRTSDTVVTITELTLAISSTDTVLVKAATQATQAASVAAVASTAVTDVDPVAGDFDITGLTATADGTAKSVTITPKVGKSAGTITRKYAGSLTAPSAAGTYAVTFDVAAAAGYNAVTGLSAGNLVISAAVVVVATSSGDGGAAAAAAARAAADKVAADKAAADKLSAEKALADNAAADKVAADKAAAEKIATEKVAAEKAETQARAAAEAIVKAEEAKVAAAEVKAAATVVKPVVTKSGTKLTLDLPDKYYGRIVTVYVGTTVKGKTTYKKLDYFVLDKEDGTATFTSKVKLAKGQTIQVKVGSTVVKSVKF